MAHAKQVVIKKKDAHPAALIAPKKSAPTRKDVLQMILDRHPASARSRTLTKH